MTTEEVDYWLNALAFSESEKAELMELLLNRSNSDDVSKSLFLFCCIERNAKKIKELEEKIACTKVEEKS